MLAQMGGGPLRASLSPPGRWPAVCSSPQPVPRPVVARRRIRSALSRYRRAAHEALASHAIGDARALERQPRLRYHRILSTDRSRSARRPWPTPTPPAPRQGSFSTAFFHDQRQSLVASAFQRLPRLRSPIPALQRSLASRQVERGGACRQKPVRWTVGEGREADGADGVRRRTKRAGSHRKKKSSSPLALLSQHSVESSSAVYAEEKDEWRVHGDGAEAEVNSGPIRSLGVECEADRQGWPHRLPHCPAATARLSLFSAVRSTAALIYVVCSQSVSG